MVANATGPESAALELVMAIVWVVFAIDYAVSLSLANPRGRWFVTHLHELLIVLLPVLRPLRLLRLVTLIAVLHRTAGAALRGRITIYVIAYSALLVLVAGLAILDAEQNVNGANITTFGDAIWWAFFTISTVGYGDYYPVTVIGRFIAVGLMVSGIALLGTVTATLASWFIELIRQDDQGPIVGS